MKRLEHQRLLFRLIADEETAKKSMMKLKTGQMNEGLGEKLKSLHGKVPPIFFIPGFEGVGSVLEPLALKVNCPIVALQFPYNDSINANITDISKRMLKVGKPFPMGIPLLRKKKI